MRLALLLRGVNLGGSRKLPMADLRALLSSLGHTDVKTILASGQAVVTTGRPAPEVAAELETRLFEDAGLRTDVLVRDGEELAAILAANPFPTADEDGSRHAVVFLRQPLKPAELTKLAPESYAPDELVANGRELYLRLPNGFADSKLSLAVGKVKGVPATTRNWNTVRKLAALT
jgi:uncharacterized protein (DUF1697 family)